MSPEATMESVQNCKYHQLPQKVSVKQVASKEFTHTMSQRPSPDLHLGNNHLNQIRDSNLELSFGIRVEGVWMSWWALMLTSPRSCPKSKCVRSDYLVMHLSIITLWSEVFLNKNIADLSCFESIVNWHKNDWNRLLRHEDVWQELDRKKSWLKT